MSKAAGVERHVQRHDQEELLNGKLAELLAEHGLDARAERREAGKRIDVVVDVGGARVVLEAETGFRNALNKAGMWAGYDRGSDRRRERLDAGTDVWQPGVCAQEAEDPA